MNAWFLSDIHLKSINERNGIILLRFLHSLLHGERPITHLFLVGDIFDIWVSDHQAFVRRFDPIVEAIYRLRLNGVEVVYFEGNHDVHLKKYWEGSLGCRVCVAPEYFKVGSWILRVEHGDLINEEDRAYRAQAAFVQSPLAKFLGQRVSGETWFKLGNILSGVSRKRSHRRRVEQEEALREMIHQHAERAYREKPFDLLVTGHMHVRDEYEIREVAGSGAGSGLAASSGSGANSGMRLNESGHSPKAINLGSWFDAEVKVLHLTNDKVEFVSLEK